MPRPALAVLIALSVLAPPAAAQPHALNEGAQRFERGDFAGAIPPLERALAADSSLAPAYPLLTTALLQTERTAEALAVARAGTRRFPDDAALQLLTAEALLRLDDPEAALERLRQVEAQVQREGADALPSNTSPARLRQRIGLLYRMTGARSVDREQWTRATREFQAARRYLPDSVATHRNLAYVHVQQEQWDEALAAADTGLARFPDDEGLLRLKAHALHQLQEYDALADTFERLHALRPDDAEVGLSYGQALMANQELPESQAVFDSLLERFPQERRIYETLIDLNRQRLNYPGLLEVLRRMEAAFPDDRSIPKRRAGVHETLENHAAARAVYDSLRTLAPDDASLALALGHTYEAEDSLGAAASTYREVLDDDPQHETALRRLGAVLEAQEQWASAQSAYERLADAHPEPHAHVRLGWVHEQRGRPDAAATAYRTALEMGTDDPLAAYRYSALLLERGDEDEAFAYAERAVRQSLRAVQNAQKLLMTRSSSAMPDAASDSTRQQAADRLDELDAVATDAFEHFATAFPQARTEPVLDELLRRYASSGRLPYLMGRYYERHGDTAEALRHFQDAADATPDFRDAHLALGRLYVEQGNPVQAIRAYERALALDETDPAPYDALIELYREEGRLDALIARWQARHRATPSNAVLRDHLVEALHKAGRYDEAQALIDATAADTSDA